MTVSFVSEAGMNLPVLPLEILVEIVRSIDATSQEGRRTLSTFARTSHIFTKLCQKRIFRDVEIDYIKSGINPYGWSHHTFVIRDGDTSNNEFTTGHLFRALIYTSPHIASYVHTLTVRVSEDKATRWTTGRPPMTQMTTSAMDSFSLYTILPRLPNLTAFLTYGRLPILWHNLELTTQTHFSRIISQYPSVGLSLFQYLPPMLFCQCTKLEHLSVGSLWPIQLDVEVKMVCKTSLRTLEIGFQNSTEDLPMAEWFRNPYPALSLSRLQSLKVSDIHCRGDHLEALLELCATTLEELDIHLRIPENTPDLSLLKKLRLLTIRLRLVSPEGNQPLSDQSLINPFIHTISTLRTLPWASFLPHQLHLAIHLSVISLPNFDNALPRLAGWSDLTTFLNDDTMKLFIGHTRLVLQPTEKYFSGLKAIPMSLPDLAEVLNKNPYLRALRESRRLSYGYA